MIIIFIFMVSKIRFIKLIILANNMVWLLLQIKSILNENSAILTFLNMHYGLRKIILRFRLLWSQPNQIVYLCLFKSMPLVFNQCMADPDRFIENIIVWKYKTLNNMYWLLIYTVSKYQIQLLFDVYTINNIQIII